MNIICRTVVGAFILGLTASLLTGAFAQGAEVPIVADGHIVGAIGVSSDTPDNDVQVANAAVAALTR